jgi:hypothetical protein
MPGSGWDPSPPAHPSSSARPYPGQSYTNDTPLPGHEKIFPVLGIRDILVRIRIPGSAPKCLMDPDPDPTLDPTPFFSDFKDAEKYFFSLYFYFYFAGNVSVRSTHL